MIQMTEAELHDHTRGIYRRILSAERAKEGVLLDSLEVVILAYVLRSMSQTILEAQ